jgi:HD-like signal output (HDOD) protein
MSALVSNSAVGTFVNKHPVVQALPENSSKIIRMCNDPDCTIVELQRIISQDAAIAGRLLKAVNSSYYSLTSKVTRLDRAIAYMGMRTVKEVTLSTCIGSVCKPTKLGTFDARDLWDHSIGVAIAARELAIKSNLLDPEEAFLAGMLHDIGLLLMVQSEVPVAQQLFASAERSTTSFLPLELGAFGFNHCELGEYLAGAWKFPAAIATGVRWHHDPSAAPANERTIASFLFVSDMLCAQAQIGCPLTCAAQGLPDEHLNTVGIDRDGANALADKLKILLRLFLT